MISEKFDRDFLEKIKESKIFPKPKWHFLLKDYLVWIAGVLSLLLGAVAFSVILYLARENDWDAYEQAGETFASFVVLTIPYFWILFLILFVFLVYYNVKHTKKGYRYSLAVILSANVVASMVLGGIFSVLGVGRTIDNILGEKAPFYGQIINQRMGYWSDPEEGRLAGIVVSIEEKDKFILLDLDKNNWWVVNRDERVGRIIVGEPIRMIGRKTSENIFEADQFFPVGGPGSGIFKRHQNLNMIEMRERMMQKDVINRLGENVGEDLCLMKSLSNNLNGVNYLLQTYPEFSDFLDNNLEIKKDLEIKGVIFK